MDSYALLIEVLHMSDGQLNALSRDWCMYMRHLRTGRLIRIVGEDNAVSDLVHAGILYPQDALLTSEPLTPSLEPLEESRHDLLNVVMALDGEIDDVREHLAERASALEQVLASRSWRLTAPLRRHSR